MMRRTYLQIFAVILLTALLSGCLFRTRTVQRRASNAPLKTATKQELVDQINAEAAKIQTLNLTVDIATSVGGAKKGKIRDYKDIRGFVLMRKPMMLRLKGLLPVVRTTAFDMVSYNGTFKLSVPPTNKFYLGSRDVIVPSQNTIENLRPQMFYDALMLRPIDAENEIAVLESGTEIVIDPQSKKELEQPDYTLDVIRKGPHGWFLSRKVMFNRTELQPRQQLIYDEKGNLVTDVRYADLKEYNGVTLATTIQIWRPQEEYTVTLTTVKVRINEPLTDEQFALAMPAGAQLVQLDQPRSAKK